MAAKGAPTAAMRRVVTLPENPEEIGRRFSEMVAAAVEQLNQGSLARAARMFAVADKLVAERRVDSVLAESARRRAQESVDLERVRSLGEDSRNHEPLARILSFFPALTATKLLDELHGEEKRERRRLLLSLLEIHGAEARATALGLLAESPGGRAGAGLALQAQSALSAPAHPARDGGADQRRARRPRLSSRILRCLRPS